MKYYIIHYDTKLNPLYPVSRKMTEWYSDEGDNKIGALRKNYGKKLDFSPDLEGIELEPRAIPTDYLSSVVLNDLFGILVSLPLANDIQDFLSPNVQSFPAGVFQGTNRIEYRYFNLWEGYQELIDYPESQFYVSSASGVPIHDIDIQSLTEYDSIAESLRPLKMIGTKLMVINNENKTLPDVFTPYISNLGLVASERFVEMVHDRKYTGFEFIETKRLIVME
jgi:hypothetical protein